MSLDRGARSKSPLTPKAAAKKTKAAQLAMMYAQKHEEHTKYQHVISGKAAKVKAEEKRNNVNVPSPRPETVNENENENEIDSGANEEQVIRTSHSDPFIRTKTEDKQPPTFFGDDDEEPPQLFRVVRTSFQSDVFMNNELAFHLRVSPEVMGAMGAGDFVLLKTFANFKELKSAILAELKTGNQEAAPELDKLVSSLPEEAASLPTSGQKKAPSMFFFGSGGGIFSSSSLLGGAGGLIGGVLSFGTSPADLSHLKVPEALVGDFSPEEVDHFRRIFAAFDGDGSGSIDRGEVGQVVHKLLGADATEGQVGALVKQFFEADGDGDGEIDFGELLNAVDKSRKDAAAEAAKATADAETAAFRGLEEWLAGLFATDGLRSSPSFATFLTQAPYAPDSKQEKSSSDWVSSPFGEPTVALDVAKVDSAAAAKNAQKAANAFRALLEAMVYFNFGKIESRGK